MTREVVEIYAASPTSEIVFYHNPLVACPPADSAVPAAAREALRLAYRAIDGGDLLTFLRVHHDLGLTPRRSRIEEFATAALLNGDIAAAVSAYNYLNTKAPAEELLAAAARAHARGDHDALAKARAHLKS